MNEPRIILNSTAAMNQGMDQPEVERQLSVAERLWNSAALRKSLILILLAVIWEAYARHLDNELLFPSLSDTLKALFRGLVRERVRPYYLLQMDPVRGTSHLRTPLERGVQIMEQLQGRLSGIALPKLIVDTPGGFGKVPHGPDYVLSRDAESGVTRFRTPRGVAVDYVDPKS